MAPGPVPEALAVKMPGDVGEICTPMALEACPRNFTSTGWLPCSCDTSYGTTAETCVLLANTSGAANPATRTCTPSAGVQVETEGSGGQSVVGNFPVESKARVT